MLNRKKSLILIVMIVFILINTTGCGVANSTDSYESSIFNVGEQYLLRGEFNTSSGGIVYGQLFVEILEIRNGWIRVEILENDYTEHLLRVTRIEREKSQGSFQDIWLNKDKILSVYTEANGTL